MKYILITLLLLIQTTTFSQKNKDTKLPNWLLDTNKKEALSYSIGYIFISQKKYQIDTLEALGLPPAITPPKHYSLQLGSKISETKLNGYLASIMQIKLIKKTVQPIKT